MNKIFLSLWVFFKFMWVSSSGAIPVIIMLNLAMAGWSYSEENTVYAFNLFVCFFLVGLVIMNYGCYSARQIRSDKLKKNW